MEYDPRAHFTRHSDLTEIKPFGLECKSGLQCLLRMHLSASILTRAKHTKRASHKTVHTVDVCISIDV